MNELQIFNNEEFGEIRTVLINEKPYFVGSDVARALGYSIPHKAVREHCKGVLKQNILTNGGEQEVLIIPEGDVYRLIFRSKVPSADRFTDWVAEEVLPSIRNTGSYHAPMTISEQIKLLAHGNVELEQKIDSVNKDLQDFKREMPLLAIECQQITEAKNKKVVPLLGGKNSNAYKNASLRGKVYRDLEGQLRREFGVSSYKAIHRNQTNKALEIISEYELPLCLEEQINDENAQINL